jgi:hypothetical protein
VANSALKSYLTKGGITEECETAAIKQANATLAKRKGREMMKEAKTKTMSGKSYPASSFLVVEDPDDTSTWHLPVYTPEGKLDHRLMGAAWAALHKGYRGNRYEGVGKQEAIKKLKALYKAEDMPTPAENAEAEQVAEYEDSSWYAQYVPTGVVSFDQLDALQQTEETYEAIQELTNAFIQMVRNVVYWYEADKVSQLQSLMGEYTSRLAALLGQSSPEEETPAVSGAEIAEETEQFTECAEGNIVITEGDGDNSVLTMEIRVIQPGWGNKIDNHYYPKEMLLRDALKFAGAKMYETDHRDDEKSTRTWVSTITDISRFDESGSPIATVKVHDPGFAERIRNLNAAGLLQKMECSIYATGKAAIGFEQDGRKGKKVTELVEVHSVDWVTRAGAGGQALNLVENSEGGDSMAEQNTEPVASEEVEQPVQPVSITEQDDISEPIPSASTEQAQALPPEPVYLTQETVDAELQKSSLVQAGRLRLSQNRYASIEELQSAIQAEIRYLSEVTGAGKPFGMGESAGAPKSEREKAEAVAEAANRVNQKYFSSPRFGG